MKLIDADAPTNTKAKKCWGCEHFRIIQEPLRCGKDIWDLGRAECNNYDLVVDFINHGKLKKLVCIESENEMNEICGDNRFEIIAKAKKHLLDATNIDTSPDEMKVLDTFLFRCWQMGWLDRYESKDEPQIDNLATAIANEAYCRTCKHLLDEDCDCDIVFTGYEPKEGE